jgi:hypothetical protein
MEGQNAGTWKYLGSGLIVGFGVVLALASLPATSAPTVLLADLVFWPLDAGQRLTPESQLLAAVVGGVMVGWGTTLFLLISKVYPRDPELVRTLVLGGVWAWFFVDSLGSLAAGAPVNVVLNVGFLIAFLVPWRRVATVRMAEVS